MARVDDEPVWAIPCFYVAKDWRGRGLMRDLLTASINWAATNGALIVEAYPFEPGIKRDSSLYTGVVSVFREAGFVEVMHRSVRRPIMRKTIG